MFDRKTRTNSIYNLFTLGCLKEVYVNDKLVDFLQAAKNRHKVSPGCSLYPEEDTPMMDRTRDPCRDNKCRRGQCVASTGGERYTCKCSRGYGGQYCDKKSSKSKFFLICKQNSCQASGNLLQMDLTRR